MNFTHCKNRCNYTKRNKRSRNPPLSVQPSQNRTIPRPAPRPCHMNALLVSHQHYPLPRTITLASLVKGEVLSPEKIRATTGGIASVASTLSIPTTIVKGQ